ncbi:MAG: hypothetical protein HYU88_09960 [Chloroflexi bacterium]|nr:hypothetical protein [Chloroflexota bacterium]MBI4505041.1 hypothetical protein [Chloroflexota bacterium]
MIDVRTITVVDPAAEDAVDQQALAPRLRTLKGATIGLIDNSKRMADELLAALGDLLRQRYGVAALVAHRKPNPSVAMPGEALDRLAASCDAVVHGVAD